MPRVKRGFTRHRRHKKVLALVKGHMTTRGHLFRAANQELLHALMYAYRDRRARKREMRSLWIVRINAAARQYGLPYNRFMNGVNKLGLGIDRKMLAEMAVNDPYAFAVIAAQVKGEAAPARDSVPMVVPVITPYVHTPKEKAPKATPAPAPAAKGKGTATAAAPKATAKKEAAEETPKATAKKEAATAVAEAPTETIAEQEAEAAGEPLEHAGTNEEQDRKQDDPQQGGSR
jgi:large subunit ribosomal protein L20